MAKITCQNCGGQYDTSDDRGMYYFASTTTFSKGDYASPEDISTAGEEMTFCPKCPIKGIDNSMGGGDQKDRDRGSEERNPTPGPGNADVVFGGS